MTELREKETENVHRGHRKRQKEKFLEHGLENFTDIEALELLLYYAIPRRDTNSLAHSLLERFGGFRGVMEADWRDIAAMPNAGRESGALIALIRELNRRYLASSRAEGRLLSSTEQAGEYLAGMFAYQDRETVIMLCLDGRSRVLSKHVVATGSADRVELPVREMVDIALRRNAAKVIVAHNHLDHIAVPSGMDIQVTKCLYQALRLIDVELVDHIVVADTDFVSMRESRVFEQF